MFIPPVRINAEPKRFRECYQQQLLKLNYSQSADNSELMKAIIVDSNIVSVDTWQIDLKALVNEFSIEKCVFLGLLEVGNPRLLVLPANVCHLSALN